MSTSTPSDTEFFESSEALAGDSPSLNLGDVLLHAVGRHAFLIGCFTLAGIAGGLFVALVQPNQYMSEAKLLVRLGQREQMTPESAVTAEGGGRSQSFGLLDEVNLLLDPALSRRVALEVGPQVILQPYDPAAEDGPEAPAYYRKLHEFQSWWMKKGAPEASTLQSDSDGLLDAAAAAVLSQSTVESQRLSNTLTVTYVAHSPELAQRVAQAFIKVARDRHREFFRAEKNRTLVQEVMESELAKAESASKALAKRKLETGLFDLHAEIERAGAATQDLARQNEDDAIRLASIQREVEVIGEQLAATAPETEQTAVALRMPNPLRAQLVDRLVDLEEQRVLLADDFTPGSSVYRGNEESLNRLIASTRERLAREPAFVSPDQLPPGLVPNPQYEELLDRRARLEQEREGLQVARMQREDALQRSRERVQELVTHEPEFDQLEQALLQAEGSVNAMTFANSRAEILGHFDRDEQMSSLQVIQEATLPDTKTAPKRGKILGIGIAAGLFLGLGLAVLRVLLDPVLRYPETVEQALGLRVLGVVRVERGWLRSGRRLLRSSLSRGG